MYQIDTLFFVCIDEILERVRNVFFYLSFVVRMQREMSLLQLIKRGGLDIF